MANFTPQQIEEFLQEFFDVVGTRQYTGARYVPIFGRAGSDTVEWDDLAPYEPLTVVMHEGVSYVSRRYVPRGIQITDTDYWVETYRFNAQVEAYRQEVLSFQGQIDGLRDTMESDYVPFPDPAHYPKYGTLGQVLSTLADGSVMWQDPVVPSDEQAEAVITQWLNDHPEATTTVEDGSITNAKLADGTIQDAKLAQTGGVLERVENALLTMQRDSAFPGLVEGAGFIAYPGGTPSASDTYRYSRKISVYPEFLYHVDVYGSTGVYAVAAYDANDTLLEGESVRGADHATFDIRFPTASYVRVTARAAELAGSAFRVVPDTAVTDEFLGTDVNLVNKATGFISATDGSVVSGTYTISQYIAVTAGQVFYVRGYASTSVLSIGAYADTSGSNAIVAKSLRGNASVTNLNRYVVPSGVNYIRVCTATAYLYNRVLIRAADWLNEYTSFKGNVTDFMARAEARKDYLAMGRRCAVINFQFDDGNAKDADIAEIFRSNGAVCGFALISTIAAARVPEYLGYQDEGFEILSHSTDTTPMADTSATSAEIETKLKNSRKVLEGHGFKVRGWVTPNSTMNEAYVPLVGKYYDFGETVYYGPYDGTTDPYLTFEDDVYHLSRVSVQTTTLANMKAAVDAAIANKGFLTFYGHAAALDTTDYETTANLTELITYINTKAADLQCLLLRPSDAFDFYYHMRHADYLALRG